MPRNLAKPYRPIREKNGNPDPMDIMRLDYKGNQVNTTGCYGTNNMDSIRGLSILNRRKAPGKRQSQGKKKKGCRLVSTGYLISLDKLSLPKLLAIRNEMVFYRALCDGNGCFTEEMVGFLENLTDYMINLYGHVITKGDQNRISTARGMIGKINFKVMADIDRKIKSAMALM